MYWDVAGEYAGSLGLGVLYALPRQEMNRKIRVAFAFKVVFQLFVDEIFLLLLLQKSLHVHLGPLFSPQGITLLPLQFPHSRRGFFKFGLYSLRASRQCIQVVSGLPLMAQTPLFSGSNIRLRYILRQVHWQVVFRSSRGGCASCCYQPLKMSWKVENVWHNTIFKPDILPRSVEVLAPEVLTAEQRPVRGNKAVPS